MVIWRICIRFLLTLSKVLCGTAQHLIIVSDVDSIEDQIVFCYTFSVDRAGCS